jgi:hypothetical protein
MQKYKLLPFIGVLLLASCVTTTRQNNNPASMLIGAWDNSAQMAAAPEAMKRPAVAGDAYEWIDWQDAIFTPVIVPAVTMNGDTVIYLAWRNNGPFGPISRQRLWVFRTAPDGKTIMDFYAFKSPRNYEDPVAAKDAFKAITLDDLIAYGPQCSLPVIPEPNGWRAAIPSSCAITARSGRSMVLSAQIVLDGESLSYDEKGTLEGGALAFKVPGGPPYRFERKSRERQRDNR